jgi:hypothetical protein
MYCRIYLPCVSIKLIKRLDLVLTFCGFFFDADVLWICDANKSTFELSLRKIRRRSLNLAAGVT